MKLGEEEEEEVGVELVANREGEEEGPGGDRGGDRSTASWFCGKKGRVR